MTGTNVTALGESIDADPAEAPESNRSELADELVDVIERPRQADLSERGPEGWLPMLDLPGFGEEYDDCGDEIPHFCEGCGHTFAVGRTCKRSECPRCGAAWVLDRAPGIVGRLDATARMMSSVRDTAVYKHHVVFSPPDDWCLEADDPLDKTFDVIKKLLRRMDAEGYVFYHPWAGRNPDGGDDRGAWKNRVFSKRDFEGDVRDELIPRGHFHAVVCSPYIPGGDVITEVNDATDWVIKRVQKRDGSGRSLADLRDVARAVTYSMSHTGLATDAAGNNQAQYRMFGSTLHDAEVFDEIEEAADARVREVAPQTLGIPSKAVRCGREVAPEEADTPDLDTYTGDDGDGEGDGADEVEELDEEEMVPCAGRVLPVDEAPEFLDDPKWLAEATCVDELREAWEEWRDSGGWDDDPPD